MMRYDGLFRSEYFGVRNCQKDLNTTSFRKGCWGGLRGFPAVLIHLFSAGKRFRLLLKILGDEIWLNYQKMKN